MRSEASWHAWPILKLRLDIGISRSGGAEKWKAYTWLGVEVRGGGGGDEGLSLTVGSRGQGL